MSRHFNIEFSEPPIIKIRVIDKNDSKLETQSKKKYPFLLTNNITISINEKNTNFHLEFEIPKGYTWNGADIPKWLFFIGQSKDNNYLVASMLHDYMLEHSSYIFNEILNKSITPSKYRKLTSLVFREILKDEKTNTLKANCMAFAVDLFQMTIKAKFWNSLGGD